MIDFDRIEPEFDRIIPREPHLEWIPTECIKGEGPVWDAQAGWFLWSDMVGNKIYRWVPGEGVSVFMDPSNHSNGLTLDPQGRLTAAGYGSRNIWRREHDGTTTELATHYDGKRINGANDIVTRSDGSIYWTESTGGILHVGMSEPGYDVQPYFDERPVFLLKPDGSLAPATDDLEGPNGLAFSPDESRLYIDDLRRRQIRIYDVAVDGTLSNGALFYEDAGDDTGNPDGMKVDVEGNVYCKASGGVHVISPEGKLLGRILVEPASNLAWGDADWQTLFIVGGPLVFRVRTEIPGVPVGRR